MLQKNPLFAQETAKKLLSFLVNKGQFQKASADPSRGALLFDSVEAEDQLDSAEFLRFLLRSIRIWATLFNEESGRNLSFFPKIFSILQKEGVVFPEDTTDLDQLSRDTTRLEGATSQAQFSSVADAWANELQSKVVTLQAEVQGLSRQAAQDYSEQLEKAVSAVENYKEKKASKASFSEQPGSSEWGGDLFRTEKINAKPKEEEKRTRDSPNFDFDSEDEDEEFELNDNSSASDSPPFSPKKPASFSPKKPENPSPIKKEADSMGFEFDDWQTPGTFTTATIPMTPKIKRPELTRDSSVELERLKATLNAKEKEATSLREANQSLLEEESRYKTTLKALQAEAQKEAAAAKDLQRQLSEKEAVLQDLRNQVNRLQVEGKTAKRTAEEAESRAAGLQTLLEVTEQNAALKLAELRKTYESSQKRLQEQVADLEISLLRANKAVEAAHTKASSRGNSKQPSRHSSSEEVESGSERKAPQPRSEPRKTNPFEEPSLRPSMPTVARDVNERWFQASLTLNEGILYEDPGLKFDFKVKYSENIVQMQVLVQAKIAVRVEEMKVVEGISGTKQAGWLFRRYENSAVPYLSRPC